MYLKLQWEENSIPKFAVMKFLSKHYGNIIFAILILLFLIPATRMPIQVFFQRLFSGSPKAITEAERQTVTDYSWQFLTIDNKPENFSDAKGKVIVLNLWATWCPPCVAELPSLQKLYDKYGDRVSFYFVSSENVTTLKTFLTKKGYKLPVYIEQSQSPDVLQSSALPTTFVISKTGKIAMRKTGAAKWNSSSVHRLLDELLKAQTEEYSFLPYE